MPPSLIRSTANPLLTPSSMSKLRLEGKVAIITGAASGIGEAAARLFAEHGAFVVVADIQDDIGHQVVSSIGLDKASYRRCDVRDEKQVEETINFALEKYGSLDILYSNAGIARKRTSILDLDLNGFDDTIAINVRGVLATIKHAARVMVEQKIRGSIICTSSVTGLQGGLGPHDYSISKAAIVGLVRTACSELGKYRIRVNCISPFGLATPMTCSTANLEAVTTAMSNLKGVVLKAKHIADVALFLGSDESEYISGHNLVVDGGFTVSVGHNLVVDGGFTVSVLIPSPSLSPSPHPGMLD